jgi:hypothetical protein
MSAAAKSPIVTFNFMGMYRSTGFFRLLARSRARSRGCGPSLCNGITALKDTKSGSTWCGSASQVSSNSSVGLVGRYST